MATITMLLNEVRIRARVSALFLIPLGLLLGACGSPADDVPSTGSTQSIVGGTTFDRVKFGPTAVTLRIDVEAGAFYCSGTLVNGAGGYGVLTAGHCLDAPRMEARRYATERNTVMSPPKYSIWSPFLWNVRQANGQPLGTLVAGDQQAFTADPSATQYDPSTASYYRDERYADLGFIQLCPAQQASGASCTHIVDANNNVVAARLAGTCELEGGQPLMASVTGRMMNGFTFDWQTTYVQAPAEPFTTNPTDCLHPEHTLNLAASPDYAEEGDSGGGLFDANGALRGVISGVDAFGESLVQRLDKFTGPAPWWSPLPSSCPISTACNAVSFGGGSRNLRVFADGYGMTRRR